MHNKLNMKMTFFKIINYFPKHSVRKEKAIFRYCLQQQLTEIPG